MNNIPTFTPPIPTFTPPNQGDGRSCHYHHNEPAVAKCAKCGKYLCQDCSETYQVNDGRYGGQPLCYDCCKQLVAANIRELKSNKGKIKFQFFLSLIGMIIGLVGGIALGVASGEIALSVVGGLLLAGVGGCFWSFIKFYFKTIFESISQIFKEACDGNWVGAIVAYFMCAIRIFIGFFQCFYYSIKNMIDYGKYMKETSGFIESDTQALQQMEEYMEYTMIRSRNVGVDLATLMNNGQLANNAYAQNVMANGEEAAEANIRNCVTSINENGEIIRSFVA